MKLLDVAKWNYPRNELNAESQLDIHMFDEEVAEFQDAYRLYMKLQGEKDAYIPELYEDTAIDVCTEMLDAWGDAVFVAEGWLSKEMANGTPNSINIANTHTGTTLDLMLKSINEILMAEFTYEYFDYNKVTGYILTANNAKPLTKTKSKVKKGKKWVDPKEQIATYIKSIMIDTTLDTLKYPELSESSDA